MAAASWELGEGAELSPGRTVLRTLGGGRRYEVMLVWDDRLFALAVAKVVRPDQAQDERALDELRIEAQVLDRLRHPVIVRGFDAVLEGPRPHVLIEHLEGPSLRSLIRRHGTLGLEQLLPLCAHVAAALHYMAGAGVVHLDVKPDNIVMGVPPRLIDLSIATPVERAARIRGALGTDAYMPPEQCDPAAHPGAIGPPSDVWGLGATLYHAVVGEVPFPRPRDWRDHDDRYVRFPQLTRLVEPLPRAVPEPLARLIASMLAPDPADRPAAADVALELEPMVEALPRRMVFPRRGTRAR